EPRCGTPVAVELEDHARIAPRKPPRSESGRRLVRTLHEEDVRAKLTQLARDADRERRVEERAVERARPNRFREPERRIVAVRPLGRAREHAEVELVAECGPFACERGVERQPVTRPPDEQHAGLQPASSSSFRSSSPKTRSGAYSATEEAAAARKRSRSSRSVKYRRTASPRASVSPAGTSRP